MRWLLLILLMTAAVHPVAAQPSAIAYPLPLAQGTETRPVQLSRLVLRLNRGEKFGRVKLGLICLGGYSLNWQTGRHAVSVDAFQDVFTGILEGAGFDTVGGTTELFADEADHRAEYLVGGTIKMLVVDACTPNSGLGDSQSAKGKAAVEIEWHLYNRLSRSVVARVTTAATFTQAKANRDGVSGIIAGAFGENLRALLATGTLHKALIGRPQDMTVARIPTGKLPPLPLPLAVRPAGAMPQVVGSTVVVQSGDGHGSGFLISRDGHFLTNRHVVGSAKYVKLRWSDGLEGLGEVIRVDRGRDVALVKSDARGRSPLRLRSGGVAVGTEVYAVGAPLARSLQNSVTRGIVSANRVLDGYSFIQSDVSVQPGNSGGPLVDARGDVLGIAVSGIRINDAPSGLNFFIPAQEALAFLSITSAR